MEINGKDLTNEPYSKRRNLLENAIAKKGIIEPSRRIIAKTPEELEKFFKECVDAGLEGIIAKDLSAPYVAGARKFAWIKLKKSYSEQLADSFDLVVIGYYFGRGKRTRFGFGGLLAAIYDAKEDKFKSITKIGTGFSEAQMGEFKEMLDKLRVEERPRNVSSLLSPDIWVKPEVVVEVVADEITKSPVHTAGQKKNAEGEMIGYALRFPRLIKIRNDRMPRDATTEDEVEEMYELQGQK